MRVSQAIKLSGWLFWGVGCLGAHPFLTLSSVGLHRPLWPIFHGLRSSRLLSPVYPAAICFRHWMSKERLSPADHPVFHPETSLRTDLQNFSSPLILNAGIVGRSFPDELHRTQWPYPESCSWDRPVQFGVLSRFSVLSQLLWFHYAKGQRKTLRWEPLKGLAREKYIKK